MLSTRSLLHIPRLLVPRISRALASRCACTCSRAYIPSHVQSTRTFVTTTTTPTFTPSTTSSTSSSASNSIPSSPFPFDDVASPDDTIYHISSGMNLTSTSVGVAIIRISGEHVTWIYQQLTRKQKLPKPRMATMCNLYWPSTSTSTSTSSESEPHRVIDTRILALYFPGPNSYTGEDIIEFHLHGNRIILRHLMTALSQLSNSNHIMGSQSMLRLASPGEFTRRAFLHGKMDLTQVEGLADLMCAETEQQHQQAIRQYQGALSSLYTSWSSQLTDSLAYVEAVIDFSEDEGDVGEQQVMQHVVPKVDQLRSAIHSHLTDARRGELIRSGFHIVIIGAPNAGKSTLLNTMCQREAAIVSAIPGTTRDIVEVQLNVNGHAVILADTAGMRDDTQDTIEMEGIRRAKQRMESADLKLALFDLPSLLSSYATSTSTSTPTSTPTSTSPSLSAITSLIDENTIIVFTKADLAMTSPHIESLLNVAAKPVTTSTSSNTPATSTSTSTQTSTSTSAATTSTTTHPATDPSRAPKPRLNTTIHRKHQQLTSDHQQQQRYETLTYAVTQQYRELLNLSNDIKPRDIVVISCSSSTNLTSLLTPISSYITSTLSQGHHIKHTDPLITRERHRQHLTQCLTFLEQFQVHLRGSDLVLCAEQLRQALRCLGRITGRVDVEDLLDVIFADFCVGK